MVVTAGIWVGETETWTENGIETGKGTGILISVVIPEIGDRSLISDLIEMTGNVSIKFGFIVKFS